jgi:hypothetical protein
VGRSFRPRAAYLDVGRMGGIGHRTVGSEPTINPLTVVPQCAEPVRACATTGTAGLAGSKRKGDS